jgi:hypothetical protein
MLTSLSGLTARQRSPGWALEGARIATLLETLLAGLLLRERLSGVLHDTAAAIGHVL